MPDRVKRRAKIDKLADDIAAIRRTDPSKLSAAQRQRLAGFETEHQELRLADLRDGIRSGEYVSERGSGGESDDSTQQPANGGVRDQARRVADQAQRDGLIPDHAAERVERLVTAGSVPSTTAAARWAVATGAEAYRGAFAKLCADPERGHLLWTPAEADAFRAVFEYQSEVREMGIGTGAGGGFLVPFHLDPAILLSSDGSTNPLRQIARIEQISTSVWNGVSSDGVVAEWKPEHAEVADASPVLADPSVPVHLGDAFVPYSYEVGQDGVNFLAELQGLLVDAADQLQAEAFVTGSGVGQPTGLVTALPAGSRVAATTPDTIVENDVIGLQSALPPRFQPEARWLMNLGVTNALGSLETTNGSRRFPTIDDGRLLNRELHEASHLDSPGDAAAAGNDLCIVYGNFRQFLIVDRIGSTLEFIPNLMGANQRPTGQRGVILWFRTGSDVLVDNAFRMLTA